MAEVSTASRATAAIAVAVAAAGAARAVASSSSSAFSSSSTSSSSSSSPSIAIAAAAIPLAAALVAAVLALTAVRLLFEFAEWARCFYYLGKVRVFFLFPFGFQRARERGGKRRRRTLGEEREREEPVAFAPSLSLFSRFDPPSLAFSRSFSSLLRFHLSRLFFSYKKTTTSKQPQKPSTNKINRSPTRKEVSSAATSSRCSRPTTTALSGAGRATTTAFLR